MDNPAYEENNEDRKTKAAEDPTQKDLPPITPNINYGPGESRRMLKNVILISFSFTFLFTAFQSMANLQSSLNTVSQCSWRSWIVAD